MNLHSPTTAIALLSMCLVTSQSLHAGILIDDFDTGDISLSKVDSDAVEESQTGLDPSRVIGGRREFLVGEFGTVGQNLLIESGKLIFETEDSFGYFDLSYGTPEEPLNLNLTGDGSDAFVVETESLTSLLPVIDLRSSGSSRRVSISSLTRQMLPNGNARILVPFEAFNGVNLQQVDQIILTASRVRPSSEITILSIATTTIPEPTTSGLLMYGILFFVGFHNKRANSTNAVGDAAAKKHSKTK